MNFILLSSKYFNNYSNETLRFDFCDKKPFGFIAENGWHLENKLAKQPTPVLLIADLWWSSEIFIGIPSIIKKMPL